MTSPVHSQLTLPSRTYRGLGGSLLDPETIGRP
jgi:hypothetical protein